jgi:peptide/nickel transport system substrate-binding protein
VRIRLDSPSAPFISNVLATMFIIPRHVWEGVAAKSDPLRFANEKPVGSGPFRLDYWRRGSELKMSAFKEHFNAPKCAGIIRIVYGSQDALATAISNGECDRTRYVLTPALVDRLKTVKNVVAKGYPSHGLYHLSYNNRIKPFDDPAFRQALNFVMPRQMISQLVLLGYADPGASIISPTNGEWHNSSVKVPAENVKTARDLLSKAGYSWDAQGRLLSRA